MATKLGLIALIAALGSAFSAPAFAHEYHREYLRGHGVQSYSRFRENERRERWERERRERALHHRLGHRWGAYHGMR